MTGTILTYLEEQGKKTFRELPFGEVDALILCQFAYLKFDGLVPGLEDGEDTVSLAELAVHPLRESLFSDERYEKVNRELFHGMAKSRRFAGMRIWGYVNLIEKEWETQFSAITVFLGDGGTFLAFRGTDESIVGWKEDCNMALLSPVPAQRCAIQYLKMAAEGFEGPFSVGGHSKGGNLAIYSAMNCSKEVRDRIRWIYNMDGPGFRREVREKDAYDGVRGRIIKILPHSSFIGMLFEQDANYRVVESKSLGLFQHNPYSWIVKDDHFVEARDVYKGRKFLDKAINEWILALSQEQIKTFVDTLFGVLEASEAEDLIELSEDKKRSMLGMVEAMKDLDEDTRRGMGEMLKALFEIAGLNALDEIDKKVKKLENGRKSKESKS